MDTGPGATEDKAIKRLSAALKWKVIAIILVVACLLLTYVGLYWMRTGGISITLSNMDEYYRVHFALYLDGELETMGYLDPLGNVSLDYHVRPGTHDVSLDYDKAFMDPHVDGVVDFFEKVRTAPFYTETLNWIIPSTWS
jgi:hypothetical protein